ncbi:MAG: MBL fold metallo-hydrolase [Planctomycetes bacterium]|nr:MBL fold metallo-hydrolase [Planctomycetota bacterium]MBI3843693.1 MBL fold metallo-hydrolase [Planctomycetota bacterium]
MFEFDRGIHVQGTSLWLDSKIGREFSFVSHAHSDHVARHQRILATPQTLRLLARHFQARETTSLPFGESVEIADGGTRVTLFPAGHILGSAQILVERDGKRLVYTGDFKMRSGCTTEPIEVRECDMLIMECTFGRPGYRFPPREETIDKIAAWIDSVHAIHGVPVLLAYATGKAQELAKALGDRGYLISAHPHVHSVCEDYTALGVRFENLERFVITNYRNRVVLFPPNKRHSGDLMALPKRRTAFVSGWAMGEAAPAQIHSDAAFPLSDHADFDELIEYVRQARPSIVYTTHGFDDFGKHLKAAGFRVKPLAEAKTPTGQLALFEEE